MTWNVRSLYIAGTLNGIASELAKFELDLVAVQDIRWDNGGSQPADDYTFLYGNWNAYHYLGTGFFVHKRIISTVKSVNFVSDRMSYIILRGCWHAVVDLSVHKPTENKSDDKRSSVYGYWSVYLINS
jgi:hypothetical protein